jgi:competence protein ComEA
MIKKLFLVVLGWLLVVASVSALELNSASQAELDALKGIGPVKSKAIVDERTKNGPFKNADDFATRVKGVGDKTVVNLEAQGLTINGSAAAPTGTSAKASTKVPGANVKSAAVTPAATTAPAPVPANAMKAAAPAMAASTTGTASEAASATHGKKSKKASKKEKAAASAASAAAAASASSSSKSK